MKLTKEQFVKYLKLYETMYLEERRIANALGCSPHWPPAQWVDNFFDLFSEMCELGAGTPLYGTDLDYFIWDLDFGRNWEPGAVIENGKEVVLSSPEGLYEYLTGKGEE